MKTEWKDSIKWIQRTRGAGPKNLAGAPAAGPADVHAGGTAEGMTDRAHDAAGRRTGRPEGFTRADAERARAYHRSFPDYAPTPLVELRALAENIGAGSIFIKDESRRFGLNAFKSLGGSYAIGHCIAEKLGIASEELSYEKLTAPGVREMLKDLVFVTATDGNHGRGVAWTAMRLGCRSVVYMPKGSASERLENIRALGAQAEITELYYDDTVRYARRMAEENGWVLVQDTTEKNYETIPKRIMQGYLTMGAEITEQLRGVRPTHIFLQAGVGSMAGAMAAFFTEFYGADAAGMAGGAAEDAAGKPGALSGIQPESENAVGVTDGAEKPQIIIVEPNGADCFYRTAAANDGNIHFSPADGFSIMAGLCCTEPCKAGWELLYRYADAYFSVPDEVAAFGMRVLGNPCGEDARVISGESGAVTAGLAVLLMREQELAGLRENLKLDSNSVILCISTEGDTDRENYRRIVWDGAYGING